MFNRSKKFREYITKNHIELHWIPGKGKYLYSVAYGDM